MILHRFMSAAEYERLKGGERLVNTTDHTVAHGSKTHSRGFCFFPEDPEKAFHWLRGIVSQDWCVTLDIPDNLLTVSSGTYRDPDKDEYRPEMGLLAALLMPCKSVERTEYCLQSYQLGQVKLLSATQKYALQ